MPFLKIRVSYSELAKVKLAAGHNLSSYIRRKIGLPPATRGRPSTTFNYSNPIEENCGHQEPSSESVATPKTIIVPTKPLLCPRCSRIGSPSCQSCKSLHAL